MIYVQNEFPVGYNEFQQQIVEQFLIENTKNNIGFITLFYL